MKLGGILIFCEGKKRTHMMDHRRMHTHQPFRFEDTGSLIGLYWHHYYLLSMSTTIAPCARRISFYAFSPRLCEETTAGGGFGDPVGGRRPSLAACQGQRSSF